MQEDRFNLTNQPKKSEIFGKVLGATALLAAFLTFGTPANAAQTSKETSQQREVTRKLDSLDQRNLEINAAAQDIIDIIRENGLTLGNFKLSHNGRVHLQPNIENPAEPKDEDEKNIRKATQEINAVLSKLPEQWRIDVIYLVQKSRGETFSKSLKLF